MGIYILAKNNNINITIKGNYDSDYDSDEGRGSYDADEDLGMMYDEDIDPDDY